MHYYLLAASKHAAHLYEVTDELIKEHPIDGMPASMADVWKGMERQDKSVQSHGSAGSTMYHGQGGAKDVAEQEEDEYYKKLAHSLQTFLHNQPLPLVFAGVAEAFGMFRSFDKSGRLIDEYIQGNPDQISYDDLKAKADPIVKEYTLKSNERFLEEYGNLLGTGRTSDDIAVILAASTEGKVDLLLIAETKQAEEHIGEAVANTIAHHGRVALIASEHMPGGSAAVAILRH